MTYWGNLFRMRTTSNIALDASTEKLAFIFTCPVDKTFNALRFYVDAVVGTPPWYKFGLQTVVGGVPSGTWLSSTYAQILSTGAKVYDMANVALSAGTVYAVVFEYYDHAGETIDADNCIKIRVGDTNNYKHPYDCKVDNAATTLFYDGGSWTDQNKDPVFVFEWSDFTDWGFPYYYDGIATVYGNTYRGERFSPPSDKAINTLGMWVSHTPTVPADSLYIVLYNITDSVEVASVTITSGEVGTTPAWVDKSITQVTLSSAKTYRIYAKSPGSLSMLQCYRVYTSRNPTGLADWRNTNWNGATDYREDSFDGGTSWSSDLDIDYPFRFTEVPPPPPPARPLINKPLINPILANVPAIRLLKKGSIGVLDACFSRSVKR